MSSSLSYNDSSLGLTVALDFATDLLQVSFSNNIWLSIARIILKTIDKALLTPVKNLVLHINQFRETIIVQWEASKAKIQAGKLMEVTMVYEQKKSEVDNLSISDLAKQKLIKRLDVALDAHMDKIIEHPYY